MLRWEVVSLLDHFQFDKLTDRDHLDHPLDHLDHPLTTLTTY